MSVESETRRAEARELLETLGISGAPYADAALAAIESFAARIRRAALLEREWQPIETCNETSRPGELRKRVWLYGEMGQQCGYVIDYGDGTRCVVAEGFHGDWKITHWMPLPKNPP